MSSPMSTSGGAGVGAHQVQHQPRDSSGGATTAISSSTPDPPSYPLPAYLRFVPGGILFPPVSSSSGENGRERDEARHYVHLNHYSSTLGSNSSGSSSAATSPRSGSGSTATQQQQQQQRGSSFFSLASSPASSAAAATAAGPMQQQPTGEGQTQQGPEVLVRRALKADAVLRRYALGFARRDREEKEKANDNSNGAVDEHNDDNDDGCNDSIEMENVEDAKEEEEEGEQKDPPHRLPSLSVLAEAALSDPLTGVPPASAKRWADALVLGYMDDDDDDGEKMEDRDENFDAADPSPKSLSPKLSSSSERRRRRSSTPPPPPTPAEDLVAVLRRLHAQSLASNGDATGSYAGHPPIRPCGYVFRHGDIAWNCRTCQSDATCVLCDACFHGSDHEGHEVFFHRTTPGGCCDCGDVEAWRMEGCCDKHRPRVNTTEAVASANVSGTAEGGTGAEREGGAEGGGPPGTAFLDDFEAVRAASRGKDGHAASVMTLPPRFAAALGVTIGAAVRAAVRAADGAGIGSDASQWPVRWSDRVCRILNGCAHDEEYSFLRANAPPAGSYTTPRDVLYGKPVERHPAQGGGEGAAAPSTSPSQAPLAFPAKYKLHLRLHNDDVHTFDEVIEALHGRGSHRRSPSFPDEADLSDGGPRGSLVLSRTTAESMTHRVDGDGQVTVRAYGTIQGAMAGFRRLRVQSGLHCAVAGTAQVDLEARARSLLGWLSDVGAAHPAASALVVQALVDVTEGADGGLGGTAVWGEARMIPPWSGSGGFASSGEETAWKRRFDAFPPNLESSYLTREEARELFRLGFGSSICNPNDFGTMTGSDPNFYSLVPYHLPSERYSKSPHALWGTLPDVWGARAGANQHPILSRLASVDRSNGDSSPDCLKVRLREPILIIDTDLRKQQEADKLTSSMYPHQLSGLHMISGVGLMRKCHYLADAVDPNDAQHLLSTSSFRAPASPLLLLLLLDPYPPKQFRAAVHKLFLSLLIDARFKSRFAVSLGAVAYRPISTLFCAGVGTEADTLLSFTVQIFTAGSLVRALGNLEATRKLLYIEDQRADKDCADEDIPGGAKRSIGVFALPIAHTVARCIHTNLLGATKEVTMVMKNTAGGNADDDELIGGTTNRNDAAIPSLVYQVAEHPLTTPLPAAPDDGFLDSRSTRHKRLPHLLRDLEYIFETPGTAMRLLSPFQSPSARTLPYGSKSVDAPPSVVETYGLQDVLMFPTVWSRLLRLAQGMDPQKRKISGGHVEYEEQRWLEAFGLSLNFAGTGDALAESPSNSIANANLQGLLSTREAVGNLFAALLREIKVWLYREGLLETGFPLPAASNSALGELGQLEALQRSTLHVSSSQLGAAAADMHAVAQSCQLSCATGVKMTEAQLALIETALRHEQSQRGGNSFGRGTDTVSCRGPFMGDWLRVPHSPLAGDCLSFHLPLHRALARSVRSMCSVLVPDEVRSADPEGWWKLPVIDDVKSPQSSADPSAAAVQHPLCALLKPTLRSSNCRVVWSAGPECTSPEAQLRRSRSRAISVAIASTKVIHSLCDHPLRCLAASQQIERHMWARNGSAAGGMALNYGSSPLCRSLRDLDLVLVQLSAAGLSVGLGARRVFALLLNRFNMDGYLCDPDRRGLPAAASANGTGRQTGSPTNYGGAGWVKPPRMQDADHAEVLAESFFSTLCVIVTELPPPPPSSGADDSVLRRNLKRELLHALAADPRSHSEAMAAASGAVIRREESDGSSGGSGSGASSFRAVFTRVLNEIGKQKNQGSRATGPPTFELKPDCSNEYDPTFFHLRRTEHQHAMDNVARLRKQKLSSGRTGRDDSNSISAKCLPLVSPPPIAHPRFLPARLLLHLPSTYAAVRRALLFALTDGQWLPPPEPLPVDNNDDIEDSVPAALSDSAVTPATSSSPMKVQPFGRRPFHRSSSSTISRRSASSSDNSPPLFSPAVVASSSKSFLEVLQILTLQVHTLEECACLHRTQPCLDDESKFISAGLSINSYLGHLIHVPYSLVNVWSLSCFPDGPLPSKGSGSNRGSVLGLLIALYEHRADHGASSGSRNDSGHGDDGHGGARALSADGLKWLLRFVNALVDGAQSVSAACRSATNGIQIRSGTNGVARNMSSTNTTLGKEETDGASWTIDHEIRDSISKMLSALPDLWPKEDDNATTDDEGKSGMSSKSREARKAAQQRALQRMQKQQANFAASIAAMGHGSSDGKKMDLEDDDEEANLCIICKCDDADGENNGPLGYLGHVQRSRVLQLCSMSEIGNLSTEGKRNSLHKMYRVVGEQGCQLRSTEAMDSAPVACLPVGRVVTVLDSKVSPKYGLLSRRVRVQYVSEEKSGGNPTIIEGWASVQSSQGYIILSPLVSMCYTNTRWGPTRPIIRQCGHAAHLRCVETHCLSLHQRAAGDQPYDGRFAANIDDGEFLCPLCKQLSNVLIPQDGYHGDDVLSPRSASRVNSEVSSIGEGGNEEIEVSNALTEKNQSSLSPTDLSSIRDLLERKSLVAYTNMKPKDEKERKATRQFGAHLLQAMQIPWDKTTAARKREQRNLHPAIRRWDFEEEDEEMEGDDLFRSGKMSASKTPCIGNILRLLRQQLIAWAAIGHSAASAEASSRGLRQFLDCYVSTDPWTDYNAESRDSHPMLLELRRTMTATSGLFDVLTYELGQQLGSDEAKSREEAATMVGKLLGDVLDGQFWTVAHLATVTANSKSLKYVEQWRVLTALVSSIPCHAAKDGVIAQRHEARATAASMWAIRGFGSTSFSEEKKLFSSFSVDANATHRVAAAGNPSTSVANVPGSMELCAPQSSSSNDALEGSNVEIRPSSGPAEPSIPMPPMPLSIRRVLSTDETSSLDARWGTINPFELDGPSCSAPFRPAVASAFLYTPLLAWDLNTFAGAIFSALLSNYNSDQHVSSDDLLQASRILIVGRLIQVLATPNAYDSRSIDIEYFEDDDKRWPDEKLSSESESLKKLLVECHRALKCEPAATFKTTDKSCEANHLFWAVSCGILPFARTLVLLLRAATSAIRQRQRRGKSLFGERRNFAETNLSALLEATEVMSCENGFHIVEAMGGPLPSQLLENQSPWNTLIHRWLASLRDFESYHGSRGNGLVFDNETNEWVPRRDKIQANIINDNVQAPNAPASIVVKENDGQQHEVEVEVATDVIASADGVEVDSENVPDDLSVSIGEASDQSEDEELEEDENEESDSIPDDDDASDVEMVEDMDMESEAEVGEETIDFEDSLGGPFGPIQAAINVRDPDVKGDLDEASKDDASLNSLRSDQWPISIDRDYAFVSRSAILPYQPSILGTRDVGPGPRGKSAAFEYQTASSVMCDLSHLGMFHRPGSPGTGLISLPRSFVELYSLVNRVKGRDNNGSTDEDDGSSSETAICLLTGAIMRSGSVRRQYPRSQRPAGACTMHARKVGSGIGIFFLVQKCTVLLMHNNKSAYSPSLYVDEHGEEDPGLRRGRPLFLKEDRFQALETLWRQQGIPREVAQIRSTSDRVIRDSWY